MYQRIKTLADEAVALQNKDRMDSALREISALCDGAMAIDADGKLTFVADDMAAIGANLTGLPVKKAKKGGAQ